MRKCHLTFLAIMSTASGTALAETETAGFIDGASAELTATNFYYNRDFRSGTGPGKREEWAQGLVVNAKSGFTPGSVGLGLDVLALADIKLDGTRAEVGTGILPYDSSGAKSVFGRVAWTGKLRAGPAELRVGSHITQNLVLKSNTSRLLPQTFNGASITTDLSKAVAVSYSRFDRSWYRDGTDEVRLTITNKDRRFKGTPDSDRLDLFSATWTPSERLKATVEQAELRDIYRQQVVALAARQSIAGGTLDAELRYYVSSDIGSSLAGPIDNRAWNTMLTWQRSGQQFAVAYQGLSGGTAMPWVGGTDGNVMNWTFINDFMERDERSWQLRYQLDGKAVGVPGLKMLVRYVHGDNARPSSYAAEGRQWQRDVEIGYAFQSQALKGFSIRWRNGFFRSNYQRDAEENRLMLIYSTNL